MAPADFQQQTISFYWKPNPGDRMVTVTATAGSVTCSDKTKVTVERNSTDIERQAEDFYTANHSKRVLREHNKWHTDNDFADAAYDGSLFFDFHHQFLSRFDSWRSEFGYPALVTWDGNTDIPKGVEIDHKARGGAYTKQPIPSWFTKAGGAAARPATAIPATRRLTRRSWATSRRTANCSAAR